MNESFLNGKVTLWAGDCLDVLPRLEEASIDSCCCDPPYHLTSIVKRFGSDTAAPAKPFGKSNMQDKTWVDPQAKQFVRLTKGFMGKQWDGGDIAFRPETWAAVHRVLKPGAHLLAFGGTRTLGRMQVAIEESGFEIRDCILWLYGSGFPKSHDVSKGIDRAAGAERETIGINEDYLRRKPNGMKTAGASTYGYSQNQYETDARITTPSTDAARQWSGFGTALKPACEIIVLARKPLIGTVAQNVLAHGTGVLNIDGCRVGPATDTRRPNGTFPHSDDAWEPHLEIGGQNMQGRWPANVCHDGSEEVVAAFPDAPGQQGDVCGTEPSRPFGQIYGTMSRDTLPFTARRDSGSASRFFYTAKADSDDRLGSKHPTVKPLDLMQWLVRLVTPPGGTCLDPFAGTGTTGEAAFREGMKAILIEREPEYQDDIRRRMKLALGGPGERSRESIKARGLTEGAGPLFEGIA